VASIEREACDEATPAAMFKESGVEEGSGSGMAQSFAST
jgi:hypothetical protein